MLENPLPQTSPPSSGALTEPEARVAGKVSLILLIPLLAWDLGSQKSYQSVLLIEKLKKNTKQNSGRKARKALLPWDPWCWAPQENP